VIATPAIEVADLSFRYRGRKRPALTGVFFGVRPGETLLILGPSGGGKSTLALCLNGLIPHSVGGELSGQVKVAGRDVASKPVADLARTVGLVFQDPDAQFCMVRVDDELAFGLENLRVPPAEMGPRLRQALATVGLPGTERARIDRLSGGTRQRVALASVLAMEPSILVFDEPTSNLDPAGAEEVFAVIARLKAAGGRTIVLIEHRLDELMGLVDRVLVLGPTGSPLAFGPPAEVLEAHAEELARLGVWVPQVSEAANRLRASGARFTPYPITVEQAAAAFGPLVAAGGAAGGWERPHPERPHPGHPSRVPLPPGGVSLPLPLGEAGRSRVRASLDATPSSDAESAIDIRHLSYTFPTGLLALSDVSLSVPRGAFFALVGPNGAGKSTLARHLIGDLRPPRGTVSLLGRDGHALASRDLTRLVGYVFQNPEHQFVARSVFDELAFGLRLQHVPEPVLTERVEQMLADFGLGLLARANPFTLSHGEKRRLSVATALILEPEILVLDEPTFGQDRQNTVALMAKLHALNEAGRTIVLITHDMRLVAEHAQQVAVLIDGKVAAVGGVGALFGDSSLLQRARLVAPPLLRLSRRLAQGSPGFPDRATVGSFVRAVEAYEDCGQAADRAAAMAGSGRNEASE
jgi:energy-coupling factor transport system ATP-binding protein